MRLSARTYDKMLIIHFPDVARKRISLRSSKLVVPGDFSDNFLLMCQKDRVQVSAKGGSGRGSRRVGEGGGSEGEGEGREMEKGGDFALHANLGSDFKRL